MKRIKVTTTFKHADDGINPIEYGAGAEHDMSDEAAKAALENDWGTVMPSRVVVPEDDAAGKAGKAAKAESTDKSAAKGKPEKTAGKAGKAAKADVPTGPKLQPPSETAVVDAVDSGSGS